MPSDCCSGALRFCFSSGCCSWMCWRYGTDPGSVPSGPTQSLRLQSVGEIALIVEYPDPHRRQSDGARSSVESSIVCRGRNWCEASGFSDDCLLGVGVAGRRSFRTCYLVSALFSPWLAKFHRCVQFNPPSPRYPCLWQPLRA